MLKFLKGVVAGSGAGLKDLPYNIGEPYSSAWGSWVHYRGTSKVSICSILCHVFVLFMVAGFCFHSTVLRLEISQISVLEFEYREIMMLVRTQ